MFDVKDMINLGCAEFYIKMTIDGESYDPFSAETLRVLPPRPILHIEKKCIAASRRKYSIPKGDAAKLIAEEEATIIRSAEEKAIIEGRGKRKRRREEAEKEKGEENEEKTQKLQKPKQLRKSKASEEVGTYDYFNNLMCKDYYETLGINKGASKDEIKKAFYKLGAQISP